MAAAVGKGSAQNINSVYFKPTLRKAYHRKSSTTWPDMVGGDHSSVGSGSEEEEVKAGCSNNNNHNHNNVVKSFVNARGAGRENHHHHHHHHHHHNDEEEDDHVSWVPDNRTGIYYPKGQEKVMEDVSPLAGKDLSVNWFSHP